MVESQLQRRSRLIKEGRIGQYTQYLEQLKADEPGGMDARDRTPTAHASLEGESDDRRFVTPAQRLVQQREGQRAERIEAWRAIYLKAPPEKRCAQRDAYEWAAAHLLEDPANVSIEVIPSRVAVLLLLEAIENDEGRRTFLKLHQAATAAKVGREIEPVEAVVRNFDWIKGIMQEYKGDQWKDDLNGGPPALPAASDVGQPNGEVAAFAQPAKDLGL